MLHSLGAFALHILGKVAVNVQCKGRSGVSQIGLKRFDVITGTNAVHCIIVAQIVDTQVGQPDFLNDHIKNRICPTFNVTDTAKIIVPALTIKCLPRSTTRNKTVFGCGQ